MKLLTFLIGLTGLLLLAVSSVSAQASITVADSAYAVDFPDTLTFDLTANSSAEINKIELNVRFAATGNTQRIKPDFKPGTQVKTSFVWDLRIDSGFAKGGYLVPGADGTFSWHVEDMAGNKLDTTPQPFRVTDTRRKWEELKNEDVAIYWYDGGADFGQTVYDNAVEVVQELRRDLGADVHKQIQVWLYGERDLFRTAMPPGLNEWVGGRSFNDFKVVMLLAPTDSVQDAIEGTRHELTHQVIDESLPNAVAKSALPHWMNEGLATYLQTKDHLLPGYLRTAFQQRLKADALPRLQGLDSNFPPDPDQALAAYGYSYTIVNFIIREFGVEKLRAIFDLFKKGIPDNDAFQQVLGVDTDGLENLWRKSVGAPLKNYVKATTPTPGAIPTFALSSADTPPPRGATSTPPPTRASVSSANTPAPRNPTSAPSSGTNTSGGGGAGGLCGGFGGMVLATFGAWQWRRRKSARL